LPSGERRKLGSVRLEVMILGRNGTDDLDDQVEGLIASCRVANTRVDSSQRLPTFVFIDLS